MLLPSQKVSQREIFKNSPYELTKQIASCDNWRADEIIGRQKTLAELAVAAWPI
jgi:hypothetical protein